jgi:pyruvate,water dikinase
MENCLIRFAARHLDGLAEPGGPLADGVQVLLRGLDDIDSRPPAHAVVSIDWYWPTLGETNPAPHRGPDPARRSALVTQRQAAEAACLTALRGPQRRRKFAELLIVTRRYATIREHQARDLTLGWPLLRACVQRLGAHLTGQGALDQPDQVFFLRHGELSPAPGTTATAVSRHDRWQGRRRHLAPLTLGEPARFIDDPVLRAVDQARGRRPLPADAVIGQPASAGRASGVVRVLTNPAEQADLQPGEILVAPATTPAWTPLFAVAAAVVTDGGALTAHASIVAREYGIPAVVGTGDATRRLHTGQHVLVDGSAGTVTPT